MALRQDGEDWEAYGMATLGLSASGATGTKAFSASGGGGSIAYIASSIAIKTAAAGGGGLSIPVAMAQYRQRWN